MELQREALQLTKDLSVRVNTIPNTPNQSTIATTPMPAPPPALAPAQAVVVDPQVQLVQQALQVPAQPGALPALLPGRGVGTCWSILTTGAASTTAGVSCSKSCGRHRQLLLDITAALKNWA